MIARRRPEEAAVIVDDQGTGTARADVDAQNGDGVPPSANGPANVDRPFERVALRADQTGSATAYAALTAALSVNSWNSVTLPLRNENTIAKSESNALPSGVVAV
jgi:hypothetical protein